MSKITPHLCARKSLGALITVLTLATPAFAQDSAFAPGWILDQDVSALRFQSVKNETKVESSQFATYTGTIDEDGAATIRVVLDSVDTKVDLRNVRMRFLFFETFKYPEAVITMKIDPAIVADLQEVRRKVVTVPYTIDLHGVTLDKEAEIAVTLLTDDKVSVTSSTPISLPVSDFNLTDGLQKLMDAAKVVVIPSATVSFDFTFNRVASPKTYSEQLAELDEATDAAAAPLETAGDFSLAECQGRFEILSRTDNIYFATGSARLQDASAELLDSITDIINRCPGLVIEVSGHTDDIGQEAVNQSLSERRAASVKSYFTEKGVEDDRIQAVGFGETKPVVANDTAENRAKNRRIEFTVIDANA